MKRIFKIQQSICLLLSFLLIGESIPFSKCRAEEKVEVRNVRFENIKDGVQIFYDLQGPANKEYTVSLILKKKSKPSFELKPEAVSGCVGEKCKVGNNLQIIWKFKKDFPLVLDPNDYYFVVQATTTESGSGILWWLASGAVVAGGAVVLLLKGSSGHSSNVELPLPPNRPENSK